MNWSSLGNLLKFVLPLLVLMAAGFLISCTVKEGAVSLEEQAQALDKTLICPVCPGETIDQSQAELARQMRAIVREMLAQGRSAEEIKQFFVKRYGEGVLASPPKRGFNLVAWATPVGGLALGLLLLALVLGRMTRGRKAASDEEPDEVALRPYLAMVDAELEKEGIGTRKEGSSSEGE